MSTFRSLHPNLKIRLFDSFLNMLLGNMLWPFMTIYFAAQFGPKLAGLLLIVNILIGLLANFYGGYLSDKYGRRKILLLGEAVGFGAFAMMALANSPLWESPEATFAAMVIKSVCWGLIGPANEAMLIDVSTSENRKFLFSLQYWAANLSLVLGGVVGGFFFESYRFELFTAVSLGTLVSFLLVFFFITETYTPAPEAKGSKAGVLREMAANYKLVFQDKPFIIFILASVFILAVEKMGMSYTGVRLAEEMAPQSLFSFTFSGVNMFGIISAENSLLVVVLTAFVTRWLMKKNETRALTLGLLLYGVGFFLLAFTNNAPLLMAAMAVVTLGELIWVPIKQAMMAEMAPEQNRSAYMAVNGLVFRGAMVLGSSAVTLGAYLPSLAMGTLFLLSAILGLVLLLTAIKARKAAAMPVQADAAVRTATLPKGVKLAVK